MSDDNPYTVLGPGQIQLSPTAREWAQEFGMSETEMARHLIEQDRLRKAGQIHKEGEG
jgi:AraC-like DNA-binding protein